jgi:radical SAM superfamily enzyme YgiQ (UPF0313 family)
VSARDGVVLVSCYELGRPPLGTAVAAAFLRRAGFEPVQVDLAVQSLDAVPEEVWRDAALVAVSVPMHTALHLAVRALPRIRARATGAVVAFFGLYASLNGDHLAERGVDAVLGGECEDDLMALASAIRRGEPIAGQDRGAVVRRADYPPPDRAGLPPASRYAGLAIDGERRVAAAVETTRGCKHLCRHCPIPPVYGGRFFAVPVEVVLEDVDRLVEDGVRHVTFADPDFLNGPTHALRVVRAMHDRHPPLTFDFTAKVEHVLRHRALLPELAASGAVFAVSAVESLNDDVLLHLDKGHTGDDAREAVALLRRSGIAPRPSLMPFSPWETLASYGRLLDWIAGEDLVGHVDPVQLSIRLLVPPGSLLASHPAMRPYLDGLDAERFQTRWTHPDPRMDRLHAEVDAIARDAALAGEDPRRTFGRIREARAAMAGETVGTVEIAPRLDATDPPRLTEPWFC